MSDMNYQQKFYAINALERAELIMRTPGDWYVSQSVSIRDGSVMVGSFGNGETPEAAIEDHWNILTSVNYPKYLVADSGEERKRVRWNGFMWENVADNEVSK